MTSEVEICNLALANIRAQSINSLNDQSVQAQYCKLKYPVARDAVLREHDWNWAHRIAPLAVLSSVDIFNWVYAYAYPSDCLRINRLVPNYEANVSGTSGLTWRPEYQRETASDITAFKVPYEIFLESDTKVIASNYESLRCDYRARITNTEHYDPMFVEALSWKLAAELAIPVIGADAGRAIRSDSLSLYQGYLAEAKAANLNEKAPGPQRESEFITVRG